ncbi:MAG: hypothetical protein IMZ55_05115 [Acidobacteria bacterium]|nr:hypothetical protein [Acidobacteriota bacterium]
MFPGEDDLPARHASHQRDCRIVVLTGLQKPGPDSKSGDLSKGGPFEVRGKLLPELPRDAPPLVIPPDRAQLALLDDEAQAEADQRGARQEDCRQKEQHLSPVQL